MKRAVTTTFAAAGFLALLATAIVWSDPDPEKAVPTAESVTALGQEARHQLSDAEIEALAAKVRLSYPLQPMKQLQADAAIRKAKQ